MKFLHTGDWHIGKKIKGYELLEEQKDAFKQVLAIAKEHDVEAIVIAGDLYDRSVPSVEAVEVFNEMMIDMNIKEQFPVLAISGNHDSATRLETGGPWFKATQFHLHTKLSQAFQPVIIGDTQFFLLPYFEPFEARRYFEDESIRTIQQGMEKVVEKMIELFDPALNHVLVAHFFAAGSQTTDSETSVTVGGLDNVSVKMLEVFDYVALGHLHNRHALSSETVKYSGTLLKYSLSEVNHDKGVWIVDLDKHQPSLTFEKILPLYDLEILEGSFEQLMSQDFYQTINRDNYIGIRLTNRETISNVMNQLRRVYPKIIQLDRVNGRETQQFSSMSTTELRKKNPVTLFEDFFKESTSERLSQQQIKWLEEEIQAINIED